jgi:hypothetical protein
LVPAKKYEFDESLTGAERAKARKRAAYLANRDAAIEAAKKYREENRAKIAMQRRDSYQRDREARLVSMAKYRETRREELRAHTAAWRAADPIRVKQSKRSYYEKNREKVLARSAAYVASNQDKLREYRQKRYAEKYEQYVAAASLRRARKMQATAAWDIELTELVAREAARLVRARLAATGVKWHADHIIPLRGRSVSGLHVWNNIAVIPAKLNLVKGNRHE